MKPLTALVQDFVRDHERVTCVQVAKALALTLDYEPSLPTVSRALASLAWDKTTIDGKVGYLRNARSEA